MTTFLSRAEPEAGSAARPARAPRAGRHDLPRRPRPAGHEAAPRARRVVRHRRPLRRRRADRLISASCGRPCGPRRRTTPGCSKAAKWPPASSSFQWRMSVKRRSAQRRDGAKISFGKIDMPDGTSIVLAGAEHVEALPVEPGRRRPGAGQPVVHHVVEQAVARHRVLGVALVVGPRPELLDDPRRLRRPASRRARSRASAGASTAASSSPCPTCGGPPCRASDACSASVSSPASLPGPAETMLRWMPTHPVGVAGAERGRDRRAPVAALGAEAVVAEGRHQLGPGVGDALDVPARRASACR